MPPLKFVVSGMYVENTPWYDKIVYNDKTGDVKFMRGEEVVKQLSWSPDGPLRTVTIKLPYDRGEASYTLTDDEFMTQKTCYFMRIVEADTKTEAFQQVQERLHWDILAYGVVACVQEDS